MRTVTLPGGPRRDTDGDESVTADTDGDTDGDESMLSDRASGCHHRDAGMHPRRAPVRALLCATAILPTVPLAVRGQQQVPNPGDCAVLVEVTLARAACVDVGERVAASTGAAAEDLPCPEACAELWVDASSRCVGKSSAAFEAAAPAGVSAACEATAAAVLTTAPRSITVSGLRCAGSGAANAEYGLKPAPLNGRPHYATIDDGWHLHWLPDHYGNPAWLISTDRRMH